MVAVATHPHPIGDAHGIRKLLSSVRGKAWASIPKSSYDTDVYDARRLNRAAVSEVTSLAIRHTCSKGRFRAGYLEFVDTQS